MAKSKSVNNLYLNLFLLTALGWILVCGSFFLSALLSGVYLSGIQDIMSHQLSFDLMIIGIILSFLGYLLHVVLIVFIYYHAGHLLSFASRFLNALVLSGLFIILLNKPFIGFFSSLQVQSLPFAFLNIVQSVPYWIAYLILAFALVYFCPTKGKR